MKKFLLSIFAVLFAFAGVQAQTWTKVTDASTLKAGDQLVIACESKGVVAGDITSQYLSKVATTFADNTISSLPADAVVLTLGGTSGAWTLSNENSELLGATALKKVAWGSGTTTWSISIDNGDATIQNGTSSYGRFLYNNTNPRFTTYTSNASSSMLLPQLYRLEAASGETPDVPVVEAPADPTLPASCNFDGSMTVTITSDATVYYTTDGTTPSKNNGTEYTAPFEITATTTVKAVAVNEGGSSKVVSEIYTKNTPVTPPAEGEVVDVLDYMLTGATSTAYINWSGKKSNSYAVYAGNSSKSNGGGIQLRSSESSGIVTTKSGGKAKKIVVEWNNTTEGRTLDVYGKNSAYSAATDLYSASTQGTKLGSIVCGTSTVLEIDGDYEYIGLRSKSGAMYLTSISITWDASNVVVIPDAPEIPATSDFVTSMDFEIANIDAYEDGTTVYYSIGGGDFKEYTTPFPITTTSEIVAYAEKDEKKSAEVRAEYTRIAYDPVINVLGDADADAFEGSIEVEIGTENGAVAYYTLNGEEPTVGSTEYEGKLTIKATATLKVIAVEEGEYRSKNVASKTFTMALNDTSVDTDAPSATFDASVQNYNSGAAITSVTIVEGITATFDQGSNSNNPPKYYSTGSAIRCYGGNNFTIESTAGTITKIVLTFSSGENNNSITTDCGTFSSDTWVGNAESVKFTIAGSTGHRRIQTITVTYGEPKNEDYSLEVTSAGWATLFLDYAVAIPEDVTCYTVSEVGETSAKLIELTDVIPANTGVIVKADAKSYVFKPADDESEKVGLMLGTTNNKYIFDAAYVLGIVDGVVGLYKAEMAGGVWLNNANKAYLPASVANGAASYSFRFGEGTTGIDEVKGENGNVKGIYDLTGRRVEAITAPGIYVVNGKKVLVK